MQILRLLAARHAASIATASPASECRDDDEGPFFDLDFSSCSVRASSSSSSGSLSLSDSDDDDDRTELDFIISLQRSRSASPLKFCASAPPARANTFNHSQHQQHCARKRGISTLRSLSFGPRKSAPLYGGRHSFARSSSGRHSFARSSTSSARSLRLFLDTPAHATEEDEAAAQPTVRRAPSRDVIRRYLSSISRRLRTAASPRASTTEGKGLRRLRKCRSASSVPPCTAASRCDDSAAEKQDGIAGAIAHCKDSLHRASTSESDSPLLRSTSDAGECEAA